MKIIGVHSHFQIIILLAIGTGTDISMPLASNAYRAKKHILLGYCAVADWRNGPNLTELGYDRIGKSVFPEFLLAHSGLELQNHRFMYIRYQIGTGPVSKLDMQNRPASRLG
jgi:hypothetical protein